jgi:hypothetical protein
MAPTTQQQQGKRRDVRGPQGRDNVSIFEIDVQNMRKIMSARDKIFIIREMVQNAWDEDITRVDILLTPPDENGHSTLRVTDDIRQYLDERSSASA